MEWQFEVMSFFSVHKSTSNLNVKYWSSGLLPVVHLESLHLGSHKWSLRRKVLCQSYLRPRVTHWTGSCRNRCFFSCFRDEDLWGPEELSDILEAMVVTAHALTPVLGIVNQIADSQKWSEVRYLSLGVNQRSLAWGSFCGWEGLLASGCGSAVSWWNK
jgi:hypothetical protein